MDAYHQILVELYKETNGRESKQIDFIALHKKAGFFASYKDICMRLNREGWISDAPTKDFVSITHWGVMEAKKSLKAESNPDASLDGLKKDARRATAAAKEFAVILESFVDEVSKDSFPSVQKKFDEIGEILDQIKSNL
jgi:hypothetical protein